MWVVLFNNFFFLDIYTAEKSTFIIVNKFLCTFTIFYMIKTKMCCFILKWLVKRVFIWCTTKKFWILIVNAPLKIYKFKLLTFDIRKENYSLFAYINPGAFLCFIYFIYVFLSISILFIWFCIERNLKI